MATTTEIVAARLKAALAEQRADIARREMERAQAAHKRIERDYVEAKLRLYQLEEQHEARAR
jgi:hypothetical protein